jgi:hypothetical protein
MFGALGETFFAGRRAVDAVPAAGWPPGNNLQAAMEGSRVYVTSNAEGPLRRRVALLAACVVLGSGL